MVLPEDPRVESEPIPLVIDLWTRGINRFPNPIQLGDAAGWTFLNDANLIDHVCRENTANYTERFLPVRRATHLPLLSLLEALPD